MKFLRYLSLVTLSLVLLLPAYASAHGAIFTFKYIDGDNLILATHNVHDAQANLPITYNLRLYTMGGQTIHFGEVEAQVLQDKKVIDKQMVPVTDYDDANLTYAYPKKGNYVLSVNFLDHGKNIAHAEFPIAVADGANKGFFASKFTLQTLVAFLLGVIVAALGYNQRKRLGRLTKQVMSSIRKRKK